MSKFLKRYILSTAILLFLGCLFISLPARAMPPTATIESFNAQYHLKRDAQKVPTMDVEEQIVVRFTEGVSSHGIERAISESYKDQSLGLKITGLTSTAPSGGKYSTYQSNGNLVVRIGDPGEYVTGTQTYTLNYSLRNPIAFFNDHDEFYWNINGTQWSQPFSLITAELHVPDELASQLKAGQFCYVGAQGSTSQDCMVTRSQQGNETIIKAVAQDQPAGSNLSMVAAFNSGTFAKDLAAARLLKQKQIVILAVAVGLLLAVVIFDFKLWLKKGRDAKGKGTIVPQYAPMEGVNSLLSDAILNSKISSLAVSAQLIELAIAGYVSLTEKQTSGVLGIGKKTDYTLTLLKSVENLSPEEIAVIKLFFDENTVGQQVSLASIKNKKSTAFAALAKSVSTKMQTDGYVDTGAASISTKMTIAGIIGFGVTFIGSVTLSGIIPTISPILVAISLSSAITLIFGHLMPARTAKGTAALEYLKGLKMFMEVAEADRIKFLQSPEGVRQWGDQSQPANRVHLFEKLLPYAIIFGIEKQWGKQFEGIYGQPPGWYNGNSTAFSTGYLIGSLGSFNTVSKSSFTAPASSGASGFGGGFSGGGGGGGGGGTW